MPKWPLGGSVAWWAWIGYWLPPGALPPYYLPRTIALRSPLYWKAGRLFTVASFPSWRSGSWIKRKEWKSKDAPCVVTPVSPVFRPHVPVSLYDSFWSARTQGSGESRVTLSVTTTVKHRPSKNKHILLSSDIVFFFSFLTVTTMFRTQAKHSLLRQILNNSRICFSKASQAQHRGIHPQLWVEKGHCSKNNQTGFHLLNCKALIFQM